MMHLAYSNFTSIGSTFSGEEDYSLFSSSGRVYISYSTFYSPHNQSIMFTDSSMYSEIYNSIILILILIYLFL